MRQGRDDIRNIALIGAAGLVGALGTMLALEATEGPGAGSAVAGDRLDGQAIRAYTMESEITVTEPARIRLSGSMSLRPRPIVYVDGIREDDSGEMLKRLNPDRVDRIEIIKGSAAQVKYGSEAENGAIQIFLKATGESDEEGSSEGR